MKHHRLTTKSEDSQRGFQENSHGSRVLRKSSGWQYPVASSASLQKCSKKSIPIPCHVPKPFHPGNHSLEGSQLHWACQASRPGKWKKGALHRSHGGARVGKGWKCPPPTSSRPLNLESGTGLQCKSDS